MKLYFMKQSALEYMKANMGTLYKNYFTFSTPDWIDELFDYDPFDVFAEVPDFELADLNLKPGEIDFENCKILYERIELSDSQASDERIWAGLCNKTFYAYTRARWQYAKRHLKKTVDDSAAVMLRYFYKNTGRSGMFRNTLARCWWVGRLTYSKKYDDHWTLLDAIGSEDIISKISDIFYSNTFSSNEDILEGFCLGLKFFRDRGIHVANREHIRPTAQYLNAIGGGILLDMLTAEEVMNLVVERLGTLIQGVDLDQLAVADEDLDDALDAPEDDDDLDAEEVNVDFVAYLDALEQTTELDLDVALGALTEVEYGCKVHLQKMPEKTFFISEIPMAGGELNLLQKKLLGSPIGTKLKINGVRSTYEIVDIRR